MSLHFEVYDTDGIGNPVSVINELLKQTEDDFQPLAVSDCFDLEDGDKDVFDMALAELNRDFDKVKASVSQVRGEPTYSGTPEDPLIRDFRCI